MLYIVKKRYKKLPSVLFAPLEFSPAQRYPLHWPHYLVDWRWTTFDSGTNPLASDSLFRTLHLTFQSSRTQSASNAK